MGSLTTFLQRGFAQTCPRGWLCSAEQPVVSADTGRRLGYAPRADVLLTRRDGAARLWNDEVATTAGKDAWGRRIVTFFARDPVSGLFAPSKYCAFVPVTAHRSARAPRLERDMGTYVSLDETETRFDGAVARSHLQHRLGMRALRLEEADPDAIESFWAL